jgi:WD40 repeat protein
MDFDFVHMADHHGKVVYVSAGRSGLVQSWELSGKPVYPPVNVGRQIDAFLAAEVKGHLLAFAAREDDSGDHAVRVWDLGSGKEIPTDQVVDFSGRLAPRFRFDKTGVKAVTQIAVVNAGQGRMLVSSARGPHGGPYSWVHAWSLEDKELEWVSTMGHKVVSLTPLTVAGVSAVAGADADGWIRVWRASDGDSLAEWHSDHRSISQLCITRVEGNDLLISAGTDGTIVGWGFQFKRAFIIDAGDPVNSLVSLADHQIVAGTDRGFMQFQLFPRAIKMLSSKSRAV